jgi:Holliday junction DNA helicase RuvA
MIATLLGKIDFIGNGYIILEVSGIGYKIFVNPVTIGKIKKGEKKKFFVHQYIRESQMDLYGFLSIEELELFELLLTVSGVGPKAGLIILTKSKPSEIKSAIIEGDLDIFTSVSGVGRKTATRIILDLKGKISADDLNVIISGGDFEEIIDALKNLGYQAQEVKKVLSNLPNDIKKPEEKIKWALQNLSKK